MVSASIDALHIDHTGHTAGLAVPVDIGGAAGLHIGHGVVAGVDGVVVVAVIYQEDGLAVSIYNAAVQSHLGLAAVNIDGLIFMDSCRALGLQLVDILGVFAVLYDIALERGFQCGSQRSVISRILNSVTIVILVQLGLHDGPVGEQQLGIGGARAEAGVISAGIQDIGVAGDALGDLDLHHIAVAVQVQVQGVVHLDVISIEGEVLALNILIGLAAGGELGVALHPGDLNVGDDLGQEHALDVIGLAVVGLGVDNHVVLLKGLGLKLQAVHGDGAFVVALGGGDLGHLTDVGVDDGDGNAAVVALVGLDKNAVAAQLGVIGAGEGDIGGIGARRQRSCWRSWRRSGPGPCRWSRT